MKKVLNLMKSGKSSSAGITKRGKNKSPRKGSLGPSSLGGESASATSMIYESQLGRSASQNRGDNVSPAKLSSDRASISESPITQVR